MENYYESENQTNDIRGVPTDHGSDPRTRIPFESVFLASTTLITWGVILILIGILLLWEWIFRNR